MNIKKLTGTGVALVTPFRKDESIDFHALEKLVNHVIDEGVDFLVVLGTTGESVTLTKDEKAAVVDFVKEVNNKRLPIVLGNGSYITGDVIANFNNFDFDGIDAILSVTPYYNKPNQKGLFRHYKAISSASPVPIILYNVPGRTGANLKPETTINLAEKFDNIIGVKEASGNLDQIMQIIKDKPKDFLVISGDDKLSLPIISMGGQGVISVIANAFPKDYSGLIKYALDNNYDKARELQYKYHDLMDAFFEDGSPGGIKEALAHLNITDKYLRKPLYRVSLKTKNKIIDLIENL